MTKGSARVLHFVTGQEQSVKVHNGEGAYTILRAPIFPPVVMTACVLHWKCLIRIIQLQVTLDNPLQVYTPYRNTMQELQVALCEPA